MTKSIKNEIIINIEKTKDYSKFALADEPWMPEVRSGDSFLALKNDIEANKLLEPIIADYNGKIYAGRSRFNACEALKIDLLVRRMSTEDAKQQAKADCLQRFHTVLDRVRFVRWVRQQILNQKRKGKLKDNISQELRKTWGWSTGGSQGQVQKYLEIITLMEKSKNKAKIEEGLRKAAHLHEAVSNLFPGKVLKASTKSQSVPAKKTTSQPDIMGKLKGALKMIGTDLTKANRDTLIRFVKKVRTLVEPELKRKQK
jgi:hypothetical protein